MAKLQGPDEDCQGTRTETPGVVAVSRSPTHALSKQNQGVIRLLAGLGVEGDAHMGEKVRHRYQVRRNPDQPNLCQVHLIPAELLDDLRGSGLDLSPGQMGENITTRGIDLLSLPTGSWLHFGEAVVELTGLRTPCSQLDRILPGLMAATRQRVAGKVVFKAGVMAVVIGSGDLRPGDALRVELPPLPHRPLTAV